MTGRKPRILIAPTRVAASDRINSLRAKKVEQARDLAMAKYHHFELASAAFQIAIVLASAAIFTGMIVLAWISGLLALAGIGITAIGAFAPHALHVLGH